MLASCRFQFMYPTAFVLCRIHAIAPTTGFGGPEIYVAGRQCYGLHAPCCILAHKVPSMHASFYYPQGSGVTAGAQYTM